MTFCIRKIYCELYSCVLIMQLEQNLSLDDYSFQTVHISYILLWKYILWRLIPVITIVIVVTFMYERWFRDINNINNIQTKFYSQWAINVLTDQTTGC